ncbi:MAG: SMC-Scp complex subunit ScpB [Acidobacteria bacterium]|nr:SMC-Scp complex subunit ScpB [Acidobacteriota bacterium]
MQPEENSQTSVPAEQAEQMLLEIGAPGAPESDAQLQAVVEAIVYVAEEPVTAAQIAPVIGAPEDKVRAVLVQLAAGSNAPERGVVIREVAGGYKMGTKPEHHEAVRAFASSLKPPLKLSLAALETLAAIAYKQPITAPEIMEIRGVQGAGVLKTLLERKLITAAGRKSVVGRPILYRTTKEFLLQFGLKDLSELPTLKEFEDLRRMAVGEEEPRPAEAGQEPQAETSVSPDA